MRKIFLAMSMLLAAIVIFNAIPVHATVLATKGLYGGQWLYPVGTVTVEQDGNDLVVTYTITLAGWGLNETHLYVGTSPPEKGSPGKFPYKHENLGGATSDTYPVSLPPGYSGWIFIAAHAVVQKGCLDETAWTCGSWINPRKGWGWGMYFFVYIE